MGRAATRCDHRATAVKSRPPWRAPRGCSLPTALADQLVIGGLPPSRLPAILGLLVASVVLVCTTLLLLRKESELARVRTEFVANVSHELRTPLAKIRLFAETLLLNRIRSPQEARRSLEIIDKEVRRLSSQVENVLQFSKTETARTGSDPAAAGLANFDSRDPQ